MPRGRSGVFCFWLHPATPGFQWVGTTSRAPTGVRVPSWGNLITN